jgi:type VI secretion system protein ImpK
MSERPKNGADPDATVLLPAGKPGPDDDATVMIPAGAPVDDDATVMIPAKGAPEDDATVMIPPARAAKDDDATVMIPARTVAPDDDATVMIEARGVEPDEDATVMMPAPAYRPSEPEAPPAEPDAEATIAIPTPGRRRAPDSPALPAAPATDVGGNAADPATLGGLNPLVAAANPVLAVVAQIRQALRLPDPVGLRTKLVEGVDVFEAAARAAGFEEETVRCSSLAMCALVDESATSTPWGSTWATDGLLASRQGGMPQEAAAEALFRLLDEKSSDAAANRDLLEFLYVCLALGYEGIHRGAADGREALGQRRMRLLEQLRAVRPDWDGELSATWRGLSIPARRPAGALGLWVAGSAAALVLAAIYAGYSVSLGGLSDPVAGELAQLKAVAAPDRPRAAASPLLAEQLAAEIARGEITVTDGPGVSTIVIRGDRLFASGSARLEPGIEPVVLRVAEVLARVPGTIVVTGHTDDVPIRTARFPSNWELSEERASSVLRLMSGKVGDDARLRAEGLAESMPAAPNDSPANRARNRRVEILLRSGQ